MKRWISGMRDAFFDSLFKIARKDENLILVTADTGAICHDEFRRKLKKQYVNIGIAEQNMIGVAAGLAMAGKIVYVYAIVPFATMRCYEQIRVDLCCMNLPVTILGIGAGFDYSTLGPTHHGTEDISLMRSLPGMEIYSPADSFAADMFAVKSHEVRTVKYIRLDRTGLPLVYKDKKDFNFSQGFNVIKEGQDLYIIATGRMVYNALKAAQRLSAYRLNVGVIDLFRIKPFNEAGIWNVISKVRAVITLEEHFLTGGLADIVRGMFCARKNPPVFKSMGIPEDFCRKYGSREYLHQLNGIDVESIIRFIQETVKNAA